MNCDTKNQIIKNDNLFFEADMHYQELEEGLWVMYAKAFYKTNVCFKMIYDEYIPIEYYSLSYNVLENKLFKKRPTNSDINYTNETWSLVKPATTYVDSQLKGTKAEHLTIYFTEKWLTRNIFSDLRFNNNSFKDFFNSKDQTHIVWSGDTNFVNNEFHDIAKTILEKGYQGVANVFALKFKVYKCIQDLFLEETKNIKLNPNLSNVALLKQLKIENFLKENLEGKFVGIEYLCGKFKISPTKLKHDFKEAYGVSLLQYFQKAQMRKAKDLIENKGHKINDIALRFGYEKASNFSNVFLKHNGKLPSFYKKK
ncbi:helix-turn-helix domain-containing protein [Flavivirga eckloniae]|nr:AraC family transcriptional regulator [Flavivirga eckloniae]